jgi:MFS family permease
MSLPEPSSTPDTPRHDPYAAWRIAGFRRFALSWFAMTISRQIETVAVGVYIYAQTNDPGALGMLGLVQALPVILLAIPGGQLADRVDRRLVLAGTLALNALVNVGLCGACYFHAPISWIFLLLVVNSVGQALGGPSRSALLPWLVPAEQFSNAVSWNTTIFRVGSMIGPALGGAIISLDARWGTAMALAVVFGGRLFAFVGTILLPAHRPEGRQTSISLESLVAGVRFVWTHKMILATITLDLFAVLLGGASYLLPAFAADVLHYPKESSGLVVGLLWSAEAVGAIVMAFVLAHTPPIRRAGWTMLQAVAAFGAATVVFGLSRNLWLAAAAMFTIGAMDNVSVVVRHTLIQMLTPDNMRGRVSAVNNVFITASNDLGGLESGLTAKWFGTVPSIVGGGIGAILVVLGCAAIWPQILSIGSLAGLRPAEETTVREESDEEVTARK